MSLRKDKPFTDAPLTFSTEFYIQAFCATTVIYLMIVFMIRIITLTKQQRLKKREQRPTTNTALIRHMWACQFMVLLFSLIGCVGGTLQSLFIEYNKFAPRVLNAVLLSATGKVYELCFLFMFLFWKTKTIALPMAIGVLDWGELDPTLKRLFCFNMYLFVHSTYFVMWKAKVEIIHVAGIGRIISAVFVIASSIGGNLIYLQVFKNHMAEMLRFEQRYKSTQQVVVNGKSMDKKEFGKFELLVRRATRGCQIAVTSTLGTLVVIFLYNNLFPSRPNGSSTLGWLSTLDLVFNSYGVLYAIKTPLCPCWGENLVDKDGRVKLGSAKKSSV